MCQGIKRPQTLNVYKELMQKKNHEKEFKNWYKLRKEKEIVPR